MNYRKTLKIRMIQKKPIKQKKNKMISQMKIIFLKKKSFSWKNNYRMRKRKLKLMNKKMMNLFKL